MFAKRACAVGCAGLLSILGWPAASAVAQRPAVGADSLAAVPGSGAPDVCRNLNGIKIDAFWGDSASRQGLHLDGRTTLDTVLTFDVAERRWTRPSLAAEVAAGASGAARDSGTTGAQSDSRRWHACIGVTLGMREPTLLLRGVRGQIHVKVDLTPLTRLSGAGLSDTTRRDQDRR